jgi:hypothetical protein
MIAIVMVAIVIWRCVDRSKRADLLKLIQQLGQILVQLLGRP